MFAGRGLRLVRGIPVVGSNRRYSSFQARSSNAYGQLDRALKGLCATGRVREAIGLLCRSGFKIDSGTYCLLLQECIFRKEYTKGRRLHSQMIVVGHTPDEYLKTKLLILYAKSGNLRTAHIILNRLESQGVVSWNAMISGYVQMGFEESSLEFYHKMRESGEVPDQFTFASVYRACASIAKLEQGKQAHGVMIKTLVGENVVVNSSLMDMYFKCSNIDDARRVFEKSPLKNVITWTALISGYGLHGRVVEVLECFHKMIDEGFTPNYVTYLAVLCACSHGGLVNEGKEYFLSMTRDYNILPQGKHYAAMVDLYGRAGRLQEAYDFVQSSPCSKHSVIWGSLLGACRIHGDVNLARIAAKKYFELEPANAGKYIVLSNAYASCGLWDKVAKVRGDMKKSGMKKEPSYSRVEVQQKMHYFFMEDNSHEQTEEVYDLIKEMTSVLTNARYVPDLMND
uniref:Pentatricopeptide repeat-containing protein n=1 Tax=Kalanchoe fedtschenkoi TaxID=63787 RepID=A0A7N0UD44_KALFE